MISFKENKFGFALSWCAFLIVRSHTESHRILTLIQQRVDVTDGSFHRIKRTQVLL